MYSDHYDNEDTSSRALSAPAAILRVKSANVNRYKMTTHDNTRKTDRISVDDITVSNKARKKSSKGKDTAMKTKLTAWSAKR